MRILAAFISIAMLCTSCMYTIHMVHTQGEASDIIDDNDTPTVDTKVDATLPIGV